MDKVSIFFTLLWFFLFVVITIYYFIEYKSKEENEDTLSYVFFYVLTIMIITFLIFLARFVYLELVQGTGTSVCKESYEQGTPLDENGYIGKNYCYGTYRSLDYQKSLEEARKEDIERINSNLKK